MTDLELRLLHCEREPSVEALSSTADEYLAVGDVEMYEGLRYMAENRKMPWGTVDVFEWWSLCGMLSLNGFSDNLPKVIFELKDRVCHSEDSFAGAVRWLGKSLIELDMV
jgi:hypothetical protein